CPGGDFRSIVDFGGAGVGSRNDAIAAETGNVSCDRAVDIADLDVPARAPRINAVARGSDVLALVGIDTEPASALGIDAVGGAGELGSGIAHDHHSSATERVDAGAKGIVRGDIPVRRNIDRSVAGIPGVDAVGGSGGIVRDVDRTIGNDGYRA